DKKAEESKAESSDKTQKTDATVKTKSKKSSKKKSKKKSLKEKRHAAYLKKLGASVAGRLKDVKLDRKSVMTKIKQVSIVSVIAHLAFFYIVETFFKFGGDGTEKSIKEIIVTMKDEEQVLKIPEQPIIEEPEPAVQEASVGEISLAQVLNPEAQSLSTIMSESVNDAMTGDVSFNSGGSQIGDIALGKGMNGRDGTFMKRVLGNKGRYGDVDVRLTLIWNGTADLDLHSTTPHEEAIFYGRKEVGNGVLDIDKNATDPVPKPVENIIWQDSEDGIFTVSLVLFSPRNDRPIPFKVEFAIFGDVYYYKGQVNKKYHEKKNIDIVSFEVRGDRYKIIKSINDKPARSIPEVEVDLVVP
ncbi:MAG: hypothetical protein NE330_08410, partial [Lentisphaeraceae bacterium]|nr:hypothetical protein [Lentisphaeraceae bacterium]